MTIEEAKNIRLADYLHSLGYAPVKQQGVNLWYKSPFREETEASFKVNTEINKWYDFGQYKVATSSHWLQSSTVLSTFHTCCNGLRNRHRTSAPCLSLFGSSPPQSRIFSVWK